MKTFIFAIASFVVVNAWSAEKPKYELLFRANSVVWGFDFLSSDKMIFTERRGAIRVLDLKTKKAVTLSGTPAVKVRGQGGMLDVRVHPTQKNRIFFSYAEPKGEDDSATALATALIEGDKLKDFKKIFTANSLSDDNIHFGSRIEFEPGAAAPGATYLYLSLGERNDRDKSQSLKHHHGKVMRLKEDGTGAEIYSYGHRNPQGLTLNQRTNEIWEAEMGPRGGDEINVVKKGKNYGWPEVTYGKEYWGPSIGVKERKDVEPPITYWVPSISPSAIAFYYGDKFKQWDGNLFVACLSGAHLRRIAFAGNKVVEQEELLKDVGARFRSVRAGPDGYLYTGTDDGQIARLVPAP